MNLELQRTFYTGDKCLKPISIEVGSVPELQTNKPSCALSFGWIQWNCPRPNTGSTSCSLPPSPFNKSQNLAMYFQIPSKHILNLSPLSYSNHQCFSSSPHLWFVDHENCFLMASPSFKKKNNWRIIALQHCIGFHYITIWIRCKYTHIPPFLSLPPFKFLVWHLEIHSPHCNQICFTKNTYMTMSHPYLKIWIGFLLSAG